MKIGIAGGGAFGTALGVALALDGNDIQLWARDKAAVSMMQRDRSNLKLPNITLPDNLSCSSDLAPLFACDTKIGRAHV